MQDRQKLPTQLKILKHMTEPKCIKELCNDTGLTYSTVACSLRALVKRGEVTLDQQNPRNIMWTRINKLDEYEGEEPLPAVAPESPFNWRGKPSIFVEGKEARKFSECALNSVRKPTDPGNRQHIHLPGSAPYMRTEGSVGTEWDHIPTAKARGVYAR